MELIDSYSAWLFVVKDNMGAWALVGVTIFLLANYIDGSRITDYHESPQYGESEDYPFENQVNSEHSAKRFDHPESSPIPIPFTKKDAITKNYPSYYNPYHQLVGEIEKDEDFQGKEFLGDAAGYQQYENSRRQSYDGPFQKETIETKSFHRKSEPYSLHEFDSKHKEEHAEVHYHQHKHLHKHAHKQEHMHHHKQDHKHHHAHKHKEEGLHKHSHKHDHKHKHHSDHHHKHDAHHKHEHKQDHKHDHHHDHKHGHKHHHGHKHDAHHKHSHKQEHKHKHDHHHGHKHHHKHSHHNDHKHKHGHKHHHQHKHHEHKHKH